MRNPYLNRRMLNLRTSGDWYRIQNKGGVSDVHVYDEIGSFGITAQNFIRDIGDIRGPINLHLNSQGGEVFDGLAIFNALKQRGNVTVFVDALAASIASVIAQAADPGRLFIGKHASMMIHDGFSQAIGNAQEMRDLADLLDQQSDNIASVYADRTGKPASFWRERMKETTWYTGEQAVEAGLADQIVDTKNSVDGKKILNAGGGWVMDEDGCIRFDPDDDGDDDSCFKTDTDHGWWDENGALLKAIPPMPESMRKALADGTGYTQYTKDDDDDEHDDDEMKDGKSKNTSSFKPRNANVDNTPWDASKAWHNGAESDNPAAFYKAICAGKKSGDPSKQSGWALPYRYTPDSAPNAAAVRNALARLDQTQGLTNKDKARAKLQKLMKKINPEYETSNSINPNVLKALFAEALKGGHDGS